MAQVATNAVKLPPHRHGHKGLAVQGGFRQYQTEEGYNPHHIHHETGFLPGPSQAYG